MEAVETGFQFVGLGGKKDDGNGAVPEGAGQITDTGNVIQPITSYGLVKAMVSLNADSTISRCYNGVTGASTGGCGFVATHNGAGIYSIDFKFPTDGRFISVTPQESVVNIVASYNTGSAFPTTVSVFTNITDVSFASSPADNPFTIVLH
jgi:hypothetical protein